MPLTPYRVRLATGWVSRRYRQPRRMIQWVRNPYLLKAKICAILLFEAGLRGKVLGARVREFFPAINDEAGFEVSEYVISQRGVMGCRLRSEHYSANEVSAELAELVQAHLDYGMVWRR
jgi:hypothetical protein